MKDIVYDSQVTHLVCKGNAGDDRRNIEMDENHSYSTDPFLIWAMLKENAAECLQLLLNTSYNENNSFQRDTDFCCIICISL